MNINMIGRIAIGARPVFAPSVAARCFTSTAAAQKSPIEAVKDGAKTIDRTVSDKLVGGIEIGETLVDKAKQTTEILSGKAAQLHDEAASTTKRTSGQAAGKAEELSGKVKGAASEVSGKAKGAAAEAHGKANQAARRSP